MGLQGDGPLQRLAPWEMGPQGDGPPGKWGPQKTGLQGDGPLQRWAPPGDGPPGDGLPGDGSPGRWAPTEMGPPWKWVPTEMGPQEEQRLPNLMNHRQLQALLACVLSHFSCVRLCNPMDCSPPGSSVHGILQARIQEWVAVPSSKGSSHRGIKPTSLMSPAMARGLFITRATWEAQVMSHRQLGALGLHETGSDLSVQR